MTLKSIRNGSITVVLYILTECGHLAKISLQQIFDGMQQAVKQAHDQMAQSHLAFLAQYFDETEDKKGVRAKTIQLEIPSRKRAGEFEEIAVPLVSLVPTNALKISEVEIEFEARLHLATGTEPDIDQSDPLAAAAPRPSNIEVEMKGSVFRSPSTLVNIKIKFDSVAQSEGVARLQDHYNRAI